MDARQSTSGAASGPEVRSPHRSLNRRLPRREGALRRSGVALVRVPTGEEGVGGAFEIIQFGVDATAQLGTPALALVSRRQAAAHDPPGVAGCRTAACRTRYSGGRRLHPGARTGRPQAHPHHRPRPGGRGVAARAAGGAHPGRRGTMPTSGGPTPARAAPPVPARARTPVPGAAVHERLVHEGAGREASVTGRTGVRSTGRTRRRTTIAVAGDETVSGCGRRPRSGPSGVWGRGALATIAVTDGGTAKSGAPPGSVRAAEVGGAVDAELRLRACPAIEGEERRRRSP